MVILLKGLYIHIPFCAVKCGYCDFYSIKYNINTAQQYKSELVRRLSDMDDVFDTVYFGGGTPSMIGADAICEILSHIKYVQNAEITVECNPKVYKLDFFDKISSCGVNRVSIGLQSANENELLFLTRNHTADDVTKTIKLCKEAGINNISLDVMLGIKGQTQSTLKRTLDYCIESGAKHISAYMLSIEENTPFSKLDINTLPTEDDVSDLYLYCCDYLSSHGYRHYEISNFAKPEYQARHNTIYWSLDEYIGLGAAAHSMVGKKRYYFPRDIQYFLNGNAPIYDGDACDVEEQIMLKLRLDTGIEISYIKENEAINADRFIKKCRYFESIGLMKINEKSVSLTDEGFLVQNSIVCKLLEEVKL